MRRNILQASLLLILVHATGELRAADSIVVAQADNRSKGVIELMNQMDALNNDLNRLRGQVEELNNSISGAQKRQKDMYLDLDSRLRRLEQESTPDSQAKREARLTDLDARLKRLEDGSPDGAKDGASLDARIRRLEQQLGGASTSTAPSHAGGEGAIASPTTPTAPTPPSVPSVGKPTTTPAASGDSVRKAYDTAMNSYKMGDYQGAISAFDSFIKKFPGDALAANAQYWIGDSYFNLHDFRAAASAQQNLIRNYPDSPKIPDAMLNLGSAYAAMNEVSTARKTLEDLIAKHPASEAADKAKQRLARLK